MWQYEDANDRQQRRDSLYADPAWQKLVKRLFALIETMETRLILPASFFTLPVCAAPQ